MKANLDGTGNNKKKTVRSCDHPDVENTLNTHIRARISFMVELSLFRENVISRIALDVRELLKVRNWAVQQKTGVYPIALA